MPSIDCSPGLQRRRGRLEWRWAVTQLASLQIFDAPKCLLPVLLQLCRDETIIGITSCVTALRETRLVLSLLEFQIPDTVLVFRKRDFRYTRWPAGWSVMLASGEPVLSQ